MKLRVLTLVCAATTLWAASAFAQPQPASPRIGDELVKWLTQTFDEAYVKPGANLASYRKVMLDQPQIGFQKNWLKDINKTRDVSRWLVPADQQKLADDMSAGMGQAFAEIFRSKGYEIVTAPGPGVLRVTPSVTDLWLNAPDTQSSNLTRTFNRETADATPASPWHRDRRGTCERCCSRRLDSTAPPFAASSRRAISVRRVSSYG